MFSNEGNFYQRDILEGPSPLTPIRSPHEECVAAVFCSAHVNG